MSANANYYKIGLFVICAVVLGVIGVIALGIGAYSDEESVMIETYFDESVQGVEIGSPVKERGVRVGKVEAIDFVNQAYDLSPANRDFVTLSRYVVVRASLKPEIFGKSSDADLKELLKDLIKEGLRIRLTSQGLTGLVYLEIDYVDPQRNPPMQISWTPKYHYLPSAPSTLTRVTDSLDQVFKRIEQTDVEGLAQRLSDFLANINQTVTDAQITTLSQQTIHLLEEVRETNKNIREMIEEGDMKTMLSDAGDAMASVRDVAEKVNKNAPELLDEMKDTATHIKDVADEINNIIISDKVQDSIENVATITKDMPRVMNSMRETLDRVQTLVVTQQQNMTKLMENMAAVSANLREITNNAKKYPSQTFFGEAPPPFKPGKRK